MNRAAEEAAIAEAIAAGKLTVLPAVDGVERALDLWRAEKIGMAEPGGGMRAMMKARRRAGLKNRGGGSV